MGDSRAHIKIEFSIYGKTFKTDMSINWFDDGSGVDRRVTEFFERSHEEAHAAWEAQLYDDRRKAEEAEKERNERAELARLKAKYESES